MLRYIRLSDLHLLLLFQSKKKFFSSSFIKEYIGIHTYQYTHICYTKFSTHFLFIQHSLNIIMSWGFKLSTKSTHSSLLSKEPLQFKDMIDNSFILSGATSYFLLTFFRACSATFTSLTNFPSMYSFAGHAMAVFLGGSLFLAAFTSSIREARASRMAFG